MPSLGIGNLFRCGSISKRLHITYYVKNTIRMSVEVHHKTWSDNRILAWHSIGICYINISDRYWQIADHLTNCFPPFLFYFLSLCNRKVGTSLMHQVTTSHWIVILEVGSAPIAYNFRKLRGKLSAAILAKALHIWNVHKLL